MKTSYFKFVNNTDFLGDVVSIAAYYPRFLSKRIETIPELTPDRKELKLFKEDYIKNIDRYFDKYLEKISKLSINFFESLKGKILCCYESDPLECHRRLLASWYEEKNGLFIPELGMDFKQYLNEYCLKNNIS